MADADVKLTGGCGCGAVRFALSEAPIAAGYCHCTRCQRRTGGPWSLQARVAPGSFTITHGAEAGAARRPGGGVAKGVRSRRRAAPGGRPPDDPDIVSVRFGVFDGDPGIRPTYRIHVDSAAPFEPIPDDGLARYGGGRPSTAALDRT